MKQVLTTPVGAQRLGGNAHGVSTWETITLSDVHSMNVRVTAVPARHGPEKVQEAAGPVNGWILEWEGQKHGVLYLSGDTVFYVGLEEITRRYQIAAALLNFGAAQVQRFGPEHITMTADEGVQFAQLAGNATIIPLHYEGWSHLTQGRDEIRQAFTAAGLEQRLRFLPYGQPVALDL